MSTLWIGDHDHWHGWFPPDAMALSGMVAARTAQPLAGKPKPHSDLAVLEGYAGFAGLANLVQQADMAEIIVIAAHPQLDQSRATRTLMEAAARLDPARVNVRDLYALYPDYFIDVQTEQADRKSVV